MKLILSSTISVHEFQVVKAGRKDNHDSVDDLYNSSDKRFQEGRLQFFE